MCVIFVIFVSTIRSSLPHPTRRSIQPIRPRPLIAPRCFIRLRRHYCVRLSTARSQPLFFSKRKYTCVCMRRGLSQVLSYIQIPTEYTQILPHPADNINKTPRRIQMAVIKYDQIYIQQKRCKFRRCAPFAKT